MVPVQIPPYLLEEHLSRAHWVGGVYDDDVVGSLSGILGELDTVTDVDSDTWVAEANSHLEGEGQGCVSRIGFGSKLARACDICCVSVSENVQAWQNSLMVWGKF